MSGKALYRKYRPTSLSDVVGQAQVTDALQNSLKQGKIRHAYLFIGPRGTGKTSVARIFAHAVNDFKYSVEDNYLDIIEIDAASNTGVDNIRELREKAIIAPTKGKYKVYIIDEVHMLTKSASNALLKTLEEPPEHVIFIMATTDAHKVPITISSRTQVFSFKLADDDTMFQHLRSIAQKEKINITDDALKIIVHRGGGSFRDSLSLLDQVATLSDQKITADFLNQTLGLPQDQVLDDLLSAYGNHDISTLQASLKDLLNSGLKPEIIASELIHKIITQPRPEWLPLLAKLPEVQPPFPEAKLLLALIDPNIVNQPISSSITTATTTTATTISSTTIQTSVNNTPSNNIDSTPIPSIQDSQSAKNSQSIQEVQSTQNSQSVPESQDSNSTIEPPITTPTNPANFDWTTFLDAVRTDNMGTYQQLLKVEYEITEDILHIYPPSKFVRGILDKPTHRDIVGKHLGHLAFELHQVGEKQPPKDESLSQISAIMGDIREIKGDLPF